MQCSEGDKCTPKVQSLKEKTGNITAGGRAGGRFVAVDCGRVPTALASQVERALCVQTLTVEQCCSGQQSRTGRLLHHLSSERAIRSQEARCYIVGTEIRARTGPETPQFCRVSCPGSPPQTGAVRQDPCRLLGAVKILSGSQETWP